MIVQEAFERFIMKKKLKNLALKTISNYICFVTPFINYVGGSLDVELLDTDLVLNYISTLYDRKLADASRATYMRHIKAFLRWMKDCYSIPVSLTEIELPKTPKKLVRILSDDDVRHLFDCVTCESEWLTMRNRAIIALMLGSGLRQNEVTTLQWKNIYISQNYAIVRGKGNKERCVPLGSIVSRFLEEYRRICPYENTFVFIGRRGVPITNNTIKKMVQKLKNMSGIDISSHGMRHNFATNYCIDSLETSGQCDAYTLQSLMGHENVKTTEKYMHYAKSMIASKNSHSHLDMVFGA